MSDLLPCPYCGVKGDRDGSFYHDDSCWLTLFYLRGERGEHVEKAWNTRATDDRLARAMALLRSLRLKLLDRVPMDADERATAVNRINALLGEDA
jgi:hypothetical protein